MPKSTIHFVCRECGGESLRWAGQCPNCRAWNTLEEFVTTAGRSRAERTPAAPNGPSQARPVPLPEVDVEAAPRLRLGWDELNRVLGGGIVPGSLVLLGGEPGVGKSTLLLHLAAQAAAGGGKVLYATGEESVQQVGLRARRLGALDDAVLLLAETDLDAIVGAVQREVPAITIVDSIQTVSAAGVDASPGSVTQVREATACLLRLAKESGVPVFLVGHVTKEGAIAGPRVLEHMVDTVLYLEGERQQEFRILRAQKNRYGSAEEIGVFAMGEAGLEEVQDPSATLLGDLRSVPGTAVLVALEGSRPLLVEVQSLVAKTSFGLPRRSATGVDLHRLHMLTAVLEKRARVSLGESDVYVNIAGGLRIGEPAADLAIALSVAGSQRNVALPQGTAAIGEVALTGQVRRVGQMGRRLQEVARRGYRRAIVPVGVQPPPGLDTRPVADLREALAVAFPDDGEQRSADVLPFPEH
ncbi:MAG: DNA repair protein RadA [Candidatus Dormibacteraeota bacterium]|nr:DNA repair protein RadA [Candidatus Dormibacteraeota bacterium]